jgi:predicted amidohydrolase YtcJ
MDKLKTALGMPGGDGTQFTKSHKNIMTIPVKIPFILFLLVLFTSCSTKEKADLLLFNATIYTVDSNFTIARAMTIKDGKILATGTVDDLRSRFDARESIDAKGRFIYPGFIDAHAHFVAYARGLQTVNLVATTSWKEIIGKVTKFAADHAVPEGDWISGFGWDQNDWDTKTFPDKEQLDLQFEDNPVILSRIDGHAAIANQRALDYAGIKAGDRISGGEIETRNGKLTGLLIDNAVDLVTKKIPERDREKQKIDLQQAERNCLAMGLTTIDDCGLSAADVQFIDSLQKKGDLQIRIYAMLSDDPSNFEFAFSKGAIKTEGLNVRSFKIYADGALGSRGACLLQPYSDKPGWTGFLLNTPAHYDSVASLLFQKGFQMCTHAIGDSGNRTILNIYGKYLKGKNDLRWRIEHAQVVNEKDFSAFGNFSVVPSIQPTHATSDMYWASERLGEQRLKGAYAYKQLLDQNGWLPLGTDFPVEDISPFKTFYAAIARKDAKGWPAAGFQMENALTREQALKGMTIWAAYSNFEEREKGSLEKGKFADFVVLDRDLLQENPEKILEAQVLQTFLAGKLVFEKN